MSGVARYVRFGPGCQREGFCSNLIVTSKYTIWNFIPKNSAEQLQKAANAYFLFISILMLIGQYTPLYVGTIKAYSTLLTLLAMMVVTAVISAMDDRKRHIADAKTNSTPARVLEGLGKTASTPSRVLDTYESGDTCTAEHLEILLRSWAELEVGDIVVLTNGDEVPADVVPLACSGSEGTCYVSTASLDGETNLKIKSAATSSQKRLFQGEGVLELDTSRCTSSMMSLLGSFRGRFLDIRGVVEAEAPCPSIHTFVGSMRLEGAAQESLGFQQFLLRGSVLRNTAWCIAVVVYTGHETRMAMNSRVAPSKRSNLECVINRTMVLVVVAQVLMALVSTILKEAYRETMALHWYIFPSGASNDNVLLPEWIANWLTFFVLYSNLMPISLYATMEACNMGHAYFIKNDRKLLDSNLPASVHTTNLCQELGQVSYIFSDKTGTLTQNIMKLQCVSICGLKFGGFEGDGPYYQSLYDISEAAPTNQRIHDFMEVLTVAHTVVAVWKRDDTDTMEYEAECPDEQTLIEAAKDLGWSFQGRQNEYVCIHSSFTGSTLRYELLALNAFTANRKMMSVVVKDGHGRYLLLAKGADEVLIPRAASSPDRLEDDLELFAGRGLRVLVVARRLLTHQEVMDWLPAYTEAHNALEDREGRLAEVADTIERRLEIIGVTAIEDKLQRGVPDTIKKVADAGIKLWVLTGDKLETARNIGYSCGLLQNTLLRKTNILTLEAVAGASEDAMRHAMQRQLNESAAAFFVTTVETATFEVATVNVALMVTGQALDQIAQWSLHGRFLEIASKSSVVIACRVSPAQKAQVVRWVREGVEPTPVCLAIGDGANDVPMLQEAQVGVGIRGREGRQAVNAADFAVAQFRFLQRLVLVHGHWNYGRICKFILYTFWRNAVAVMLMFYYTLLSGYSGTSLYDDKVRMSFNVVLALPITCTGLFDRDVDAHNVLSHPQLYARGRLGSEFDRRKMFFTLTNAFAHSLILFQLACFWPDDGDYYTFGTAVFTIMLVDMNLKMFLVTKTWNWLVVVGIVISFLMYIAFIIVYGLWQDLGPLMYGVPFKMTSELVFWYCFIALPMQTTMLEICLNYVKFAFSPSTQDLRLERIEQGISTRSTCSSPERASELSSIARSTMSRQPSTPMSKQSSATSKSSSIHPATFPLSSSKTDAGLATPRCRTSSFDMSFPDAREPRHHSSLKAKDGAWVPSATLGLMFQNSSQSKPRTDSQDNSAIANADRTRAGEHALWTINVTQPIAEIGEAPTSSGGNGEVDLDLQLPSLAISDGTSIEDISQLISNTAFAQQKLPSMQLKLGSKASFICGIVSSLTLLGLGLHVQSTQSNATELRLRYDAEDKVSVFYNGDDKVSVDCRTTVFPLVNVTTCNVKVPRAMSSPIRVSYIIAPFYQSQYTYLASFSQSELNGEWISNRQREQECGAAKLNGSLKASGRYLVPCGLQAESLFNDTFALFRGDTHLEIDTNHSSWTSDRDRFENPDGYPKKNGHDDIEWLYERYGIDIVDKGVKSERFVTWMRPNALRRLKNIYGFVRAENGDEGVALQENDTLKFEINSTFPVRSFGGIKELVLETNCEFGGIDPSLRRCLLITSALCFCFTIFVCCVSKYCPRQPGKNLSSAICCFRWRKNTNGRTMAQASERLLASQPAESERISPGLMESFEILD